jgi:hypothetical protein
MTTADVRREWLSLVDAHVCHRHEPGDERHWCPEYDRMPRDGLRRLQGEKLRLAVRYLYELSPMYHRKLDDAGIDPAGVRGVDDLARLPFVTKQEMSASVAAHPPFGEYTAVDDDHWNRHGWMLFNTSGTTAQPRSFRYTDFDREMWTWTDATRTSGRTPHGRAEAEAERLASRSRSPAAGCLRERCPLPSSAAPAGPGRRAGCWAPGSGSCGSSRGSASHRSESSA